MGPHIDPQSSYLVLVLNLQYRAGMWRLFLLLVALWPITAAAQPYEYPPILTIPAGEDRIVALQPAQAAPFAGQLFSTDTAIRWGLWLEQYRYRLVADRELAERLGANEQQYQQELLAVEQERARTVEEDLRARLLVAEQATVEAAAREWYDSPVFGLVIGVLGTSLIFGLAVGGLAAAQSPG